MKKVSKEGSSLIEISAMTLTASARPIILSQACYTLSMRTIETSLPVKILSVEDNDGDRLLVKTAFFTVSGQVSVDCVGDGTEAMKYLKKEPPYEAVERPHLILLDLNLPGMNGKEVLEMIKTDPELKEIPVLILSGSIALKDVEECYALKANCYLQKPAGFGAFVKLLYSVNQFWVRTPPPERVLPSA